LAPYATPKPSGLTLARASTFVGIKLDCLALGLHEYVHHEAVCPGWQCPAVRKSDFSGRDDVVVKMGLHGVYARSEPPGVEATETYSPIIGVMWVVPKVLR
jgi:hypothetical protein